MPKINKASNDYISRLQDAIRRINGCESRYLETVTISESFQGFQEKALWEGEVVVFEIFGHPKATRAYAWSCISANEKTRYVVVLNIPPVVSPQTGVQAAIAAQILDGTY
jgi:hypothetical protein